MVKPPQQISRAFLWIPNETRPRTDLVSWLSSPQAWSAAAFFSLLGSCLGLSIDALARQVRFHRPYLPDNLPDITIRDLFVGDAVIDCIVTRQDEDASIQVINRTGDVSVLIHK